MTIVTGTMVRDLLVCERRVHLDLHGDRAARDPVSSFVEMLWRGGRLHEDGVVVGLPGVVLDLRVEPSPVRREMTLRALGAGGAAPDWIVGGRVELDDRVGVPDLMTRVDGVWHVGDAKSGSALDPAGRPNLEYAAQVGFYAAMLGDASLGAADRAFVIDRRGATTWYDLLAPRPDGSIAELVDDLVADVRAIAAGAATTRPALSAGCAMCHWRTVCRADLERDGDLTLVAGLGRALREALEPTSGDVAALAALDDAALARRIPGVGPARLRRFRDRARLLATPGAGAFARAPLDLPQHARELHFDLETNPLDDGLVYLHGVLDRSAAGSRYHAFFADGHKDEGCAFAEAWAFLHSEPRGHVYHYSRFERTSYRALAARHPHVCTAEEVEELFSPSRSTDLLVDIVQPWTEWPTAGVGIKALAKSLGFAWRDADASGAASIGWFVEWCEGRAPEIRERILAYNEDDCRAQTILLDALRLLPVLTEAPWPAFAA